MCKPHLLPNDHIIYPSPKAFQTSGEGVKISDLHVLPNGHIFYPIQPRLLRLGQGNVHARGEGQILRSPGTTKGFPSQPQPTQFFQTGRRLMFKLRVHNVRSPCTTKRSHFNPNHPGLFRMGPKVHPLSPLRYQKPQQIVH